VATHFEVRLTARAEKAYLRLCEKGETFPVFTVVEEAITKLIPEQPINRRYALAVKLSNVFQFRKGAVRIGYYVSLADSVVFILYVCWRGKKPGDTHDVYPVFANMILGGHESTLAGLGIRLPDRTSTEPLMIQ